MISFLNGEILKFLSDPKRIVLLVNGIGYEIYIPEYLNNYFVENKVTIGSNLDLEIYYHVTERQPKPLLVGFISYSDKEFFEQLIQVEGIGPVKAANSLVFPITLISVFIFLFLASGSIGNAFSDLTATCINLIDNLPGPTPTLSRRTS